MRPAEAGSPVSRHPATVDVVVGRIGKAHGLSGEVSIEVRTDDPDRRFAPGTRLLTDPPEHGPLIVRSARWGSGRLHLSFEGASDRTTAEALRGVLLAVSVDPAARPEDPEEYYDHQLVGLTAVAGEAGSTEQVGEVVAVLHLPGQDTLVIRRADGTEVLVPFVADIVPDIDLAGGQLRLTPPTGLLDQAPGT